MEAVLMASAEAALIALALALGCLLFFTPLPLQWLHKLHRGMRSSGSGSSATGKNDPSSTSVAKNGYEKRPPLPLALLQEA